MPPRRQPPPPAGESKTGLIVALVVCVLLMIVSGALAYIFYADNAKALEAKNTADAAAKDAKNKFDEAEVKRVIDAILIGKEDPADRSQLESLKTNKAYGAEIARLKAIGIDWNPAEDKPPETLIDRISKKDTEIANLKTQAAAADSAFQVNLKEHQGSADSNRLAADTAKKLHTEAAKNELAAKNAKAQEYTGALETIKTVREEYAKIKQDKEGSDTEYLKRIKGLEETIKDKDNQNKRAQALLDQKRDNILESDQPKGAITKVDNRNSVCWLNIGSADNVRPQLTFSVLAPSNTGKAGKRERKGAIEIVKVLGEKLSEARITDVTNALQDPIMAGDLLFNPAWDPNQHERIALAGLIDLNGDGIDDTQDLIRSLEKQGIQIDSYLDIRDQSIKGRGISVSTSYLVLGEIPITEAGIQGQEKDEREKKKAAILDQVQKMKDQAGKAGVQIVQAKQFLKQIGYPLPKNTSPPNFVPAGASSKPLPGPGEGAKPATPPAKKPDDEGK
jgi:hypothetical protein